MINILFNYEGDVELLKEQSFIHTTYQTVIDEEGIETLIPTEKPFTISISPVTEMEDGCFLMALKDETYFDAVELYMETNGKLEVIGMWDLFGQIYIPKKDKNKYEKTKYLKWLLDKWTYDENGDKVDKLPKDFWQVNNYFGWQERQL